MKTYNDGTGDILGIGPCAEPAFKRFNPRPFVGQTMTVRGVQCRIVKIHAAGTVDVVSLDGSKAFRVSGLSF